MKHDAPFIGIPAAEIPGAPVDWDIRFRFPGRCPTCGERVGPRAMAFQYLNLAADSQFCTALRKCGACKSNHVTYFHVNRLSSKSEFLGVYPASLSHLPVIHREIPRISPVFADLYRQALDCAARGQTALAAVGLHSALQVLVRDYAVNILGKKPKKVDRRGAVEAHEKYLPEAALKKCTKLRRLLGSGHLERVSAKDIELLRLNIETAQLAICAKLTGNKFQNRLDSR